MAVARPGNDEPVRRLMESFAAVYELLTAVTLLLVFVAIAIAGAALGKPELVAVGLVLSAATGAWLALDVWPSARRRR